MPLPYFFTYYLLLSNCCVPPNKPVIKPVDINKKPIINKVIEAKDIKVNDSNKEIDKEVIKEMNNEINKQNDKLINYQNNKKLDKNIVNLGDKVVNEVGNRQKIISVEDGGNNDIIDFNLL